MTKNTKNKFHFNDQHQLYLISQDILKNVDNIFAYFGISFKSDYKKYVGKCPIHGGDNESAFNLFHENETGKGGHWKCFSHGCEAHFIGSPIGLVRGLLSRKNHGWESPGDETTSFEEAVNWCISFLDIDIDILEIDYEAAEKLKFIRQVKNFHGANGKANAVDKSKPKRKAVRLSLQIPAQYYIDRGYSSEVLDEYDVGFCANPRKFMYARAVVPIYDNNYEYMIGCSGRSIWPFCPFCKNCHKEGGACPDANFPIRKWMHNKGFKGEEHLYNYWKAKNNILDTGIAVVVESPGNVWKLAEAGIRNAVGLFGSSMSDKQKIMLDTSGAMTLVLMGDNDAAGRKLNEDIKERCKHQYNIIIPKLDDADVGDMTVDKLKQLYSKHCPNSI